MEKPVKQIVRLISKNTHKIELLNFNDLQAIQPTWHQLQFPLLLRLKFF